MRAHLENYFAIVIANNMECPSNLLLEKMFQSREAFVTEYTFNMEVEDNFVGSQEDDNHDDWMEVGDEGLLSVFSVVPYETINIVIANDCVEIEVFEVIIID